MDDLNAYFPTWVANAHSPRPQPGKDTEHTFGSQMFDAAADVVIKLTGQAKEEASGIGLEVSKANDIPTGRLSIYAMEWQSSGLSVVRRARPTEFSDIEAGKKQGVAEEIRDYLLLVGKASATEIARELGRRRDYVSNLLRASNTFQVAARDGHKVLYSVRAETTGF